MRNTPRHLFVDEALASRAYEDTALPIGKGQTISQPYIVARMTEVLLEGGPLENVLEVGTGSGYQTAVLAPLVRRVYTTERIKVLLEQARRRFQALKIRNVITKHTDGGHGPARVCPVRRHYRHCGARGYPSVAGRAVASRRADGAADRRAGRTGAGARDPDG